MAQTVYNIQKEEVKEVSLPKSIFDVAIRPALITQVAQMYMMNKRLGTSSVKSRHYVSGSTVKIYRQKGTGNARHGDIKAPIFVGGGQTFGPRPRDWSCKIPWKVRAGAIKSALTMKVEGKKLVLLDEFDLGEIKTKAAKKIFDNLGLSNALLVVDKIKASVGKSVRNLQGFKVVKADDLNLLDILRYEGLVFTLNGLKSLEDRLG